MTIATAPTRRVRWATALAGVAASAAAALGVWANPAYALENPLAKVTPALAQLSASNPTKTVEVIVQFNDGSLADAKQILGAYGLKVERELPLVKGVVVEAPALKALDLAKLPTVETVTINGKVLPSAISADPAKLRTQFPGTAKVDKDWKLYTGKGVGVAVVDTGVQGNLPDFAKSPTEPKSRVVASAVANPNATTAADKDGHGTHVAGIIAGNSLNRTDSKAGAYIGVAPEADIVSVKVAGDDGSTTVADVIDGIKFAIDYRYDYNIRVLNLSLNSSVAQSYKIDPLNAAVESAWLKGIVVVAAAGNRGAESDAVSYAPANDPYVITVGGTDERGTTEVIDDVLATWSSRGRTQDGFAKPEIAAPGRTIVSLLSPNSAFTTRCATCIVDGDYFRVGGTSMAAGVIAGAAAVLLEANSKLTPNQVKGALVNTSARLNTANVDKALLATSTQLRSNENLTPNDSIDPATGDVKNSATWSRASWSTASDYLRASWSRASWSASWSSAQETDANWSRASWSRASWSTMFE